MLKVVSIVDKKGSALDRLARGVAKYHTNIDYHVIDIHPKRPSPAQITNLEIVCKDADLIDAQYFKSIEMLRSQYDWIKDIPTVLTHNNPYSIIESDWNDYVINVGNNQKIYKRLGEITQTPVEYIPLTVDTDFWTYNTTWSPNNRVLMVANRIESKKGVLEVAKACKQIGAKFTLVGAISDTDYFHEVIRVGDVQYCQQVSDEELRHLYYNSTLHVCNSTDNFESGTLPILEAMLCGTPVLTRSVGHVPDLNNDENMIINEAAKDDIDHLANLIEKALADPDGLNVMRDKAWQTAKSRSHERRAYLYQKLYRQALFPDQQPVTIVTPVHDYPEITAQCIEAIAKQTYKNIELIVVNDGLPQNIEKPDVPFFRFIGNYQDDYGLARARNKGVIEATGDIIVFCDQRIIMQPDAVERLVEAVQPGKWVYGNKGVKKEFVENFSAVRREDIIRAGMFNERIDMYGGQSQEIRTRFRMQGNRTEAVDSARAEQVGKSSNRNRKRDEIIKMKSRLWKMNLE